MTPPSLLDPDLAYVPINDLFVMIDDRPETRKMMKDPEALAEFFRDHWPEKLVEPTVDEEKDPQAWEEFQRHAEWEENRDYGEITEQLERLKDRLALTAEEQQAIRAALIRVLPGPETQYQASLWLSNPDWSQIDWTEGLPPVREFRDDELPLNKDPRYAMSISPASLRDPFGVVQPLRAQLRLEPRTPPRRRAERRL